MDNIGLAGTARSNVTIAKTFAAIVIEISASRDEARATMDFEPYMNYVIAGLAIVAVLILAMMVYSALASSIRGRRGSRLGISEYHEIDKSRRLVLIRRDAVEHLLLIGGDHDLVVESGIGAPERSSLRPAPARYEGDPAEEAAAPIPMRPAPRPPIFGERKPVLRPVEREPRFSETKPDEPEEKS
jgi:hypothetical protein